MERDIVLENLPVLWDRANTYTWKEVKCIQRDAGDEISALAKSPKA